MSDSDSDYIVEEYVKPDKIGALPVNDECADLLGNFDESKRKSIEKLKGLEEESPSEEDDDDDDNDESEEEAAVSAGIESDSYKSHNSSSSDTINVDQINALRRGVAKSDRHVLYVTNLNFATDKQKLIDVFSTCGQVKGVRIPKKRKGGFAFIEMADILGFQVRVEIDRIAI